MGTQTDNHIRTELHGYIKCVSRKDKWDTDLVVGGWFRCEHGNDWRMGKNNQPACPSVFFLLFLWIKDGQDDFMPMQIDSVKLHMRDDVPNLDLLVPSVSLSHIVINFNHPLPSQPLIHFLHTHSHQSHWCLHFILLLAKAVNSFCYFIDVTLSLLHLQ